MEIDMNGFSIQGKRKSQQDYSYWNTEDKESIAILCDGMGGLNGGERASQYAVNRFRIDYKNRYITEPIPAFLSREIMILDEAVYQLQDGSGNRLHAGTTVAAVVLMENQLYWLSAGDSRIYMVRNQEMCQITRDHNYGFYLNQLLDTNQITRDEYQSKVSKAESLISYLGMGNLELYDRNADAFFVQPGDQLLLCSDGIYKTLSDDILYSILEKNSSSGNIIYDIRIALEQCNHPYQDNATAISICVKS